MKNEKGYFLDFDVMWCFADLNGHLRNTAYSDYATSLRTIFLNNSGYSVKRLKELHIGPVILNEFIQYRREVHLGDKLRVYISLAGQSEDTTRWLIRHNIYRLSDEKLACSIIIEGAWLDLNTRKISTLPAELDGTYLFDKIAKDEDFKLLDRRSKLKYTL